MVLSLLSMMACHEEEAAPLGTEAEIVGLDFTRWICGGGVIIRTEDATFTVHAIPNQEIADMLDEPTVNLETPIPVYITINDSPASSCATEFDNVKELNSISLRD